MGVRLPQHQLQCRKNRNVTTESTLPITEIVRRGYRSGLPHDIIREWVRKDHPDASDTEIEVELCVEERLVEVQLQRDQRELLLVRDVAAMVLDMMHQARASRELNK